MGAISTAGERERGRERGGSRSRSEARSRVSRDRERSRLRPGDLERVRDRGSLTWRDIVIQGCWVGLSHRNWRCVYQCAKYRALWEGGNVLLKKGEAAWSALARPKEGLPLWFGFATLAALVDLCEGGGGRFNEWARGPRTGRRVAHLCRDRAGQLSRGYEACRVGSRRLCRKRSG